MASRDRVTGETTEGMTDPSARSTEGEFGTDRPLRRNSRGRRPISAGLVLPETAGAKVTASKSVDTPEKVKTGGVISRMRESKIARDAQSIWRGLQEIQSELKKVVWPTRRETTNLTLVVIGLSTIIGVILFLVDTGLVKAYEWVLTHV